jgi:hypothetical protein
MRTLEIISKASIYNFEARMRGQKIFAFDVDQF